MSIFAATVKGECGREEFWVEMIWSDAQPHFTIYPFFVFYLFFAVNYKSYSENLLPIIFTTAPVGR